MNPALPRQHFVPDSEARVMPDGRLYVYGSYDICGNNGYCSGVLHVFSTENLSDWTDHGVVFSVKDIPWAREGTLLYAPDCIHRDGQYYLYFCLSDGTEGVAVSTCPYGPFENAQQIEYASGDGIDPAIFIDDDKRIYYFWGQFSLRAAEMNCDMKSLKKETVIKDLIDEKRFGFHEGASIRKYKDTYILLYTSIERGKATCLSHATAKHPLGPYTYRGVVIDNIGCDPNTWNNHGSIECVNGRWYVFYHRSSQNTNFNRRLCIEPIEIAKDGFIKEVAPTSQGAGEAINALSVIPASVACRLGGWGTNAYIAPDCSISNEEVIMNASESGWAVYRYIRFEGPIHRVWIEYQSDVEGEIEVWADDQKIAVSQVHNTNSFYMFSSAEVLSVKGIRTMYLQWRLSLGQLKLRNIRFE